ncbi:MAG: hypothetical protein VX777_02985 [Chlamydiota bacterium]|nr:hypothetical protein [Chlamydiota bacterium]
MIKKIISSVIICAAIIAIATPNQAEAIKLKVEPSITFRNTHEHTRVRAPHARRVARRYYYAPRPEVVYVYPEDNYYYYEDEYYAPRHYRSRTSSTDYGLTFKIK